MRDIYIQSLIQKNISREEVNVNIYQGRINPVLSSFSLKLAQRFNRFDQLKLPWNKHLNRVKI